MQQEVYFEQTSGILDEDAAAKAARRERKRIIRRECRVQIEMLVRCSSGFNDDWTTNKVEVKGRLLDMNMEGVMFRTRESFVPGQELRLALFLPNRPAVIANVSVRWSKPLPEKDNEFATGTRFTSISRDGLKTIHAFFKELREDTQN